MIEFINNILGTTDYPFITAFISLVLLGYFMTSLLNIFYAIFKRVGGYS